MGKSQPPSSDPRGNCGVNYSKCKQAWLQERTSKHFPQTQSSPKRAGKGERACVVWREIFLPSLFPFAKFTFLCLKRAESTGKDKAEPKIIQTHLDAFLLFWKGPGRRYVWVAGAAPNLEGTGLENWNGLCCSQKNRHSGILAPLQTSKLFRKNAWMWDWVSFCLYYEML